MKELTIEEKAAHYDKALEIARKINSGEGVAAPSNWTTCEVIFPELKESEDERIRNFISNKLACLRATDEKGTDRYNELTEAIAWLEKQGEQKPKNCIYSKDNYTDEDRLILCGGCEEDCKLKQKPADIIPKDFEKYVEQLLSLSDGEGHGSPAKVREVSLKLLKLAKVEHNPAEKVEPKFKVGDWIYHEISGNAFHINRIVNHTYISDEGATISFGRQNDLRLWTVEDAKDGDVLYCKSCGIEYIVMSKGINEHGNIDSYVRYNSLSGFGIDIPNVLSTRQDCITPATKEQRDTLIKAMADAGYTFDFEEKKLKVFKKLSDYYDRTRNFKTSNNCDIISDSIIV